MMKATLQVVVVVIVTLVVTFQVAIIAAAAICAAGKPSGHFHYRAHMCAHVRLVPTQCLLIVEVRSFTPVFHFR
jgi:hypothetical protein